MKRILAFAIFIFLLLGLVSVARASSHRTFSLPPHAKKITENLYDLGQAVVNGRLAQGYAIVHYKNGQSHRPNHGKGGSGGTTCYGFLAKDARWKTTEPYVLNEFNNSGMPASFVSSVTSGSMGTWDNQVAFQVFGSRNTTQAVDGADTSAPDNKNEVYFAGITDPGVIGVTIVWGYFAGPPFARELIEYDMVFDDVDYRWGDATLDPLVMDYQNIATHELGHAAGLADLYESTCSQETMYGYAAGGETKKRDLNTGDIQGIKTLYK